ncbi:hypothetical protein HJG60_011056 [Phyllostomus discolor]|uniref:Uncharacterized protein n=1 Tax=Phyllostomus discolor TaxID=89673 RepID=A0A834AHZ5_9CHIR|nr:hypothetical protein HJG60_011056 [Phyllostomus discolor]
MFQRIHLCIHFCSSVNIFREFWLKDQAHIDFDRSRPSCLPVCLLPPVFQNSDYYPSFYFKISIVRSLTYRSQMKMRVYDFKRMPVCPPPQLRGEALPALGQGPWRVMTRSSHPAVTPLTGSLRDRPPSGHRTAGAHLAHSQCLHTCPPGAHVQEFLQAGHWAMSRSCPTHVRGSGDGGLNHRCSGHPFGTRGEPSDNSTFLE